MKTSAIENFGNNIRKLREERKLPLRTVALHLQIDQAVLSKIENGKRKASRQLVVKLAEYFELPESDLLVTWLSDSILYQLQDEDTATQALHLAEQKIVYNTYKPIKPESIILKLKSFFAQDGRVEKAGVFGSFARGESHAASDVDVMVRFFSDKRISMFDITDMSFRLGEITGLKIDLVEEDCLEPYALATARHDMIDIYG